VVCDFLQALTATKERATGIHGLAGWVIHTAGLEAFEKRYNFYLCGESNHDFLDVQPVTQVMHQLRCPGSVVITVGLFSLAWSFKCRKNILKRATTVFFTVYHV